jgi:hypothetical protein
MWTDGDGLSIFFAKNGVRTELVTARSLSLSLDGWLDSIGSHLPNRKNIKFQPSPLHRKGVPPFFGRESQIFYRNNSENEPMVREGECVRSAIASDEKISVVS